MASWPTGVDVDVVIDGAVDVSSTVAAYGKRVKMRRAARCPFGCSAVARRKGDDSGGAHVHGAVNDKVEDQEERSP